MADLIGSGRSIAAATTAMQLMAAPVVLVASLSVPRGKYLLVEYSHIVIYHKIYI